MSYGDRKAMSGLLRMMYTAPTEEAAVDALGAVPNLGRRYPAAVAVWERAWERFIPFLAFPPALRKIIYTTNKVSEDDT